MTLYVTVNGVRYFTTAAIIGAVAIMFLLTVIAVRLALRDIKRAEADGFARGMAAGRREHTRIIAPTRRVSR